MELTPRLKAIANLVPAADSMADIGTDHAYIPIEVIKSGKVRRAIASDINEGPARMAAEHISGMGLSDVAEVRVGPGLSTLSPHECEGAVIAGMGGLMIIKILENDRDVADSLKWLVLQPMNHIADLRIWLASHGCLIEKEALAKEGWHIYDVMLVKHGHMEVPDALMAEVGVTEGRLKDPLLPDLVNKLIRGRNAIVNGIGEDTENSRNKEKRLEAQRDIKRLEDLL